MRYLRSLMLLPFALRNGPALRAQWHCNRWPIVGVGVLSPLAYTLVLYAIYYRVTDVRRMMGA